MVKCTLEYTSLLEAAAAVEPCYLAQPQVGAARERYLERVYCYELYHRWRCAWPPGSKYTLVGELDKAGHSVIRGNMKPDFLVHSPGKMVNLLAVEVKIGIRQTKGILKDIRTLNALRCGPAQYKIGVLWFAGVSPECWGEWRAHLVHLAREEGLLLDPIRPVIHSRAGVPAVEVSWGPEAGS